MTTSHNQLNHLVAPVLVPEAETARADENDFTIVLPLTKFMHPATRGDCTDQLGWIVLAFAITIGEVVGKQCLFLTPQVDTPHAVLA
jgi:hypothetical protein